MEIWCSNREIGGFDEKLGDSGKTGRVGRYELTIQRAKNIGQPHLGYL